MTSFSFTLTFVNFYYVMYSYFDDEKFFFCSGCFDHLCSSVRCILFFLLLCENDHILMFLYFLMFLSLKNCQNTYKKNKIIKHILEGLLACVGYLPAALWEL